MPDDTAPDTTAGSGLNRRVLGGIPLWGVYAIAVAGGVVLITWWKSRQANAANSAASQNTTTDTSTGLDADQAAVFQSEILALQGQKSVPGPAGPAGPRGPAGPPGPSPSGTPTSGHGSINYYTVVPGDSLSKIAASKYHNANLWPRIYDANKSGITRADGTKGFIKNPDLILPGWRLIIP